jgi:parvulin-like peptidyl-prolyl isomerase
VNYPRDIPPIAAALPVTLAVLLAISASPAAEVPISRPAKLSDLFVDEVLARGKGVEVKRSELDEAFIAQKAKLSALGQPLPEAQRPVLEAQLLRQIIFTQMLTNHAKESDLKLAGELAQKRLKAAMERAVSEEAFYRQLKAAGVSADRFHRDVTEASLAEAVIQRELTATISVTDAQVQEFYANGSDALVKALQADLEKLVRDPASSPSQVAEFKGRVDRVRKANLARLELPEKVHVSHIFLTIQDRKTEEPLREDQIKLKREQLEKLRKRALKGEDFPKLVKEFSEDRGLAETKGEYTFAREDPFVPEFKAAAFSLQPGSISDVVTSSLGLHVIKLIEKIPAKKVEYETVAADLKEFLIQQETQRALPDFFSHLAKEAGVEILSPKYQLDISANLGSP